MGGENWHAIKKLFNPPFLILKVRHPAVTGAYCIVRDSRSGCSNDLKWLRMMKLCMLWDWLTMIRCDVYTLQILYGVSIHNHAE